MTNNVEILAPAGSVVSLQASFKAGADAVYMGGSAFGARAYADNPDDSELLEAIDYAHLRSKRVYLTVNTLVKENETDRLLNYLAKVYEHGIDAVIVQDVGVMKLIADNFSKLPIHVSTQAAVTDASALKYMPGNITRVVPARELTINEIAKLKNDTGLEIEVFTHGALCYSYSGNCLFSSMCGDRSGNRGRCAQPCRLKTGVTYSDGSSVQGKYLISPKDLCTIDYIPELVKAGVDSFKIEGRMKAPEYAAYMSYAYKKALDLYVDKGEEGFYKYIKDHASQWNDLKTGMSDLYNRGGFTIGYAFGSTGPQMMSVNKPNHQGTVVGSGILDNGYARISLDKDLNKGDVIMLDYQAKDKLFDYTTAVEYKKGDTFSFRAVPKGKERFYKDLSVSATRIRNNSLIDEIDKKYIESPDKARADVFLYANPGEELILTAMAHVSRYSNQSGETSDGSDTITVTVNGPVVEPAKNQPVTEESIREKLVRSGDSQFDINDCQIVLEGDCFIPKSVLGNVRREALEKLEEQVKASFRRCASETSIDNVSGPDQQESAVKKELDVNSLKVSVYSVEQLKAAVTAGAKTVILDLDSDELINIDKDVLVNIVGQPIADKQVEIYIKSRRITDETNIRLQKSFLDNNHEIFKGAYIKNLGIYSLYKEYTGNILADKWIYAANKASISQLQEIGLKGCVLSQELTYNELADITSESITGRTINNKFSDFSSEYVVYGREELMISKQCIKKTVGKCNKTPELLPVTNELLGGNTFWGYQSCSQCRNIIFDGQCINLISQLEKVNDLNLDYIQLSFTIENGAATAEIVRSYIKALEDRNYINNLSSEGFYGHFYKQTL